MSTIQTKDSTKRVTEFIKKGGDIFNNQIDNRIFKDIIII